MKLLYIGYLLPEKEYYENDAAHLAAGKFELGLLSGLENVLNDNLEIITAEPNYSFPKGPLLGTGGICVVNDKLCVKKAAYINLPILKHITLAINLFFKLVGWTMKNRNEQLRTMSYNLDTPMLQVLTCFQKFGIGYYPVICDLPFYDEVYKGKGLKSKLSQMAHRAQFKYMSKTTGSIILNENIDLDYKLKNSLLVEGGVSENNRKFYSGNNNNKFVIHFSGSIDVFHGSDKLCQLAEMLNGDMFEIIVCGRGADSELLRKTAALFPVLKYEGVVSQERLMELQQTADLLIIPHPTSLRQLRYQFPSKLMEYMLNGVPVLTTPLPGLPSEYLNFVYVSESDSTEDLYNKIIYISKMGKDELKNRANKAKEFVCREKNWDAQAERIISFLGRANVNI